jgi:ABC-type antimicrobial peptide transport system permease subunit
LGIVLLTQVQAIGTIVRLLDPMAYVAGVLLIIAGCAAAAWVPTVRAARLDPMKSLRHD